MPLPVEFFERAADEVAKDLLGKLIIRKTNESPMVARIVETEAYFGENDPASHACRGMTPRNAVMFGRAGIAYVYLNYGIHNLLNVVTGKKGCAGAVLIRAVEPLEGIGLMLKNRPVKDLVNLTNGPGKLTQALDITLKHNGVDLTDKKSDVYLGSTAESSAKGSDPVVVGHVSEGKLSLLRIKATPRIGISAGVDLLLRFAIDGNAYVSK